MNVPKTLHVIPCISKFFAVAPKLLKTCIVEDRIAILLPVLSLRRKRTWAQNYITALHFLADVHERTTMHPHAVSRVTGR